MRKEWFEDLSQIDKTINTVIGLSELRPYIYDRTLLYGYTCERKTFHVYMKNQKIYTVIYEKDFASGGKRPKNMKLLEVKSNRDYIPDKRVYPEASDFHFCRLLKERGIDIPFTTWVGEYEPDERGFYGLILEDSEGYNEN